MSADKNFESHYTEGTVIADRTIPEGVNALDYSDILKFSNCNNATVSNCSIEGGKEDCIDAVRGENLRIVDCSLTPHKNGITLKGSFVNYCIENVKFLTHGFDCDMEFGQFDNYWYIGRKPTRGGIINDVNAADGKPVVTKLWDATTPTITNSNVKIIKIPKIIWWPYFVFRCIQVRGFKNIMKPVDTGAFIASK
jgi:hypothetical protein